MLLAINRRLKKAKNKKGFTLVELLVVIAILGVLAALIVPKVFSSVDKSKTRTDEANVKILQNAVERYNVENDANWPSEDMHELVPNYIEKIPTPVATGSSFTLDTSTHKVK